MSTQHNPTQQAPQQPGTIRRRKTRRQPKPSSSSSLPSTTNDSSTSTITTFIAPPNMVVNSQVNHGATTIVALETTALKSTVQQKKKQKKSVKDSFKNNTSGRKQPQTMKPSDEKFGKTISENSNKKKKERTRQKQTRPTRSEKVSSSDLVNKSTELSTPILLDENTKKKIIEFVTEQLTCPPNQMDAKMILKLVHKQFKLRYPQLTPFMLMRQILLPTLVFYQELVKTPLEDGQVKKTFTLHYDPDRIYKLPNLKKRKYRHVWRFNHVKSGTRPLGEGLSFEKRLEQYELPEKIKNVLDNKRILEKHAMNMSIKSVLSKELKQGMKTVQKTPSTHTTSNEMFTYTHNLLETLLHVEEAQMIYDIKQYDISGTTLKRVEERFRHGPNSKHYRINCAGLAEKRPSVLRGDLILCRPHHETKAKTVLFKGFIHFVNLDHVIVSFHESVENYEKVDISFRFSRTPLKLMHRALSMCDNPYFKNILSGAKVVHARNGSFVNQLSTLPSSSNFCNNLNQAQKTALLKVLAKPKVPEIIFGPPGTGKTYLVAQCILEIVKQDPKHRILVCTPSNQAADIIVERLVDGQLNPLVPILRMNSVQRDPNTFTKNWIKKFSNKLDAGFEIPEKTEISKYNVIISTCTASGYLYSKGVESGHFSHIIVDESGESVIPEALIPLSLMNDKTVVVLAGDPKQLGPIVRSPLALEYGLGESLLEHLVKLGDACCSTTQLQQSYRAHPKIMEVYSSVFYDNSLISSCSDTVSANLFINNPILKNPQVPMIFYHVKGDEKRDNDSPSWYNSKEIQVVLEQLDKIVNSGLVFNSQYNNEHEIGIITPYRKQAEEIKKVLRRSTNKNYQHIFVGTTEQFQGQERRVIILTTVRSSSVEGLEQDSKFKLGFLQNPKRLNVAISRAISLMIVVGNAELLSTDEQWKKIISIYQKEKCFVECDDFSPPSATTPTTKRSKKAAKSQQYNTESLEIKRYE